MRIPAFEEMMKPLLELGRDGKEHAVLEAENYIARKFRLSKNDRLRVKPSGGETTLLNRLRWARLYLKRAGLITYPRVAYYQITDLGTYVIDSNPRKINTRFLLQFPQFRDWYYSKKITKKEQKKYVPDKKISITNKSRVAGYPTASFKIDSGNSFEDISIATEMFNEIHMELAKQQVPIRIVSQSGSIEIFIEILQRITEHPVIADTIGRAVGIVMNRHHENREKITSTQFNNEWKVGMAIFHHVVSR